MEDGKCEPGIYRGSAEVRKHREMNSMHGFRVSAHPRFRDKNGAGQGIDGGQGAGHLVPPVTSRYPR